MISYCVRCRKNTETKEEQDFISKNGRHMKRGACIECGATNTRFVKGTKGGSLINTAINKLPVELHLPGHNFSGPGTRLDKRLNPNLTPKAESMPVNRVDKAAYHHDVCYLKNKDTKTRNKVCDKNMLEYLKSIQNPTLRERLDRSIVDKIIGTKLRFGMGVEKKPNKHKMVRSISRRITQAC